MNYIQTIKDSVITSMSLKIFSSENKALHSHIFDSKLKKISMHKFLNKIYNFNPDRLQNTAEKAYPPNNRPRKSKDISSVKFHQKQIKNNIDVSPIWVIKKNNQLILLDGAHRIVASYIENEKYIMAYVIALKNK